MWPFEVRLGFISESYKVNSLSVLRQKPSCAQKFIRNLIANSLKLLDNLYNCIAVVYVQDVLYILKHESNWLFSH